MGSGRVKRIVEWLRERRVPGNACVASTVEEVGVARIVTRDGHVAVACARIAVALVVAGAALVGTANAAPGDNLALGKPVTMSGGNPADPTQQGANCTDGTTAGAYPTNTICRTIGAQTGANREWIEVDLGQDYVIDRVRLFNRTDGTNGDLARWIVVTTRPSTLTGVTSDPQSTLDTAINPSAPFVNKLAYAAGNTGGVSYGTGQAAAYASLDLQIGRHIARYVRIYSMKPAPTALNLAEIEVFEGPPPIRTIGNASFEVPDIASGGNAQIPETLVPGWSTTEPVADPTAGASFVNGGNVEMWDTGFGGVTADDGRQFVELNAFSNGALSPYPLCVYPGETFQWRVSHRARGAAAQVDVAKLRINGEDIATFSDGTTQAGTHTCAPAPGYTCTAQAGSPTATGWGRWQGSWTNTAPTPAAMTFEFAAISATGPGFGNFIDNVSITGLAAAVELSGDASGSESTATANLPTLLVNGPVTVAQTIQLDLTGGSATRGVDYTTTPAAGPISVTIPVGTYDGTAATAISLAPYVQVTSDFTIEGDETIVFGISNASGGLSIAGASGCRAGVATATYTILDVVQPQITVTKTAAPSPFQTGQPASYTVTLENTGNATTVGNITLTDTLPAGITLASASGTNWSCTGTTALTCTYTGTLAPGASTALTLNVNVGLGAVSTGGNNSATARGGGDPDCPAAGATAAHCTGTVNVSVISGYVCSPSTIFVAQATPTQLNAQTYGSGGTTFTPIGPTVWSYNAIGFRAADNFIYGISGNLDAAHPENRLLRVDPGTGVVSNLGAITGGLPATGSANIGAFDGSGNYLIGQSSETRFYRVNLTTRVSTAVNLVPATTPLNIADFTFANGFLWGAYGAANPAQMVRINPTNGAVTRYNLAAGVIPTGPAFGAAWTFGNGNLGFSDNNTGNVYQIRVTNPTGTPTFARVSLSPGPTSGQNDGTSCVSPPIDLAIAKTGPASVGAGGAISWTLTVTNNGPYTSSGYTVTDTVPAGITGIASPTPGCTVAGSTVTCVGGTLAVGASATFTINGTAPTPFNVPVTNVATVEGNETDPVAANDTATHTVNPPPPANVVVTKALIGENGSVAGQAEPGEQLTYTITLTNTGGQAATGYGVTDTLDPNVTFVSATAGGTFAAGAVTWSGLTVPVGSPVTLTVVVQVNNPIPDGVALVGNSAYQTGSPPPSCSAQPTPPNCTLVPTVPKVRIEKIAGAPAPTGAANEYRITYTVTVANNGGSGGSYDLADTLTFNGATVTAITPPAYASTTGDVQSGTLGAFAPPAGGTIVSGETIGALGVETWTYTVTYTIANPAVASNCAAPSGGLRNSAALGGGTTGVPAATTCSGAPIVSILKTAATPVPLGPPNQFAITYTVNVANTGTLAGSYNLADNLTFNGATVNAVSAPAYSTTSGDTQTGTLGVFGLSGGTIVTGEPIAASGAETWTYTVSYTVTDPGTAQNCAAPGGGLRNNAELGGSLNGQATSCTGAPAVVIAKAVSGPVPTGNLDEYRLSYVVTVHNDGTLPGTYSLADAFGFLGVSGVTVSAVTHSGTDPLATPLGTLTATGGNIVTNETIAVGGIETYAYDVVFTVADVAALGSCSAAGGLRNAASLGGSSAGSVQTCSDVPNIVVTKTAGPPIATGAPNQYFIAYTVTVTNSGNAAGAYDLSDAFDYAGAVVDAVGPLSHVGPDPLSTTLGALTAAGGTIVNAEPIAAATSETYGYSVIFTLTNPALANDCASPSGGLRNSAALGGSVDGSSASCSGVPVVAVTKALTAESGTQTGIAEPGELLTYTITLTNTGSAAATSYSVSDNLDANTSFVSATGGGTYAGGVVTWSGLSVAAGGTTTVTVTVIVNAPVAPGVTQIANVAYQTGTPPPLCPPASPSCVVVPTSGSVTIAKMLTGESGTRTGVAEAGEQLTYTITLTNAGGSAALNYGVTDQLDPNVTFVSATNGGTAAGGVVTWTGLTVPASGNLVLTVVVAVNDPLPPGVTQIGNVAYETGSVPPSCPPAGAQCVVVPTEPQVSIVKALASESGTQPGAAEPGEQLTYTITLTNTGGTAATNYGVTDTLDPNTTFVSATNGGAFAAGSVTWSGLTVPASGNLVLTVVVAVNDPLPPGVTQIGNVAYETGTTPPACPPAGPQCVVVPTAPQIVVAKTAGTPVATGAPNQYAITYVATMRNNGGSAGTYTLADALTFNGATVNTITVPAYATSTGDTQTGTTGPFGPPNGGTIVTGESLASLGVETWTYTVTYTVTDPALAANCASPSGGLRNSAGVVGGGSATTCSGAPNVGIVKTATTPAPTGTPNQFTLTYRVEVVNTGTLAGTYDLDDVLTFNGATVNGVTMPAYSTTSGDTQTGTLGVLGIGGGTIVTGETIAVSGAEAWTYTVTYTVTDAAVAQNCANPAAGLRNGAALGGSFNGQSTTCTGAPAVVIGKSASGPTPTGNVNEYAMTYRIDVQNNGTLPGTYDLLDTFVFPGATGVTVSPVSHAGADPLATLLGTLTPIGGTIVTNETIAVGSNENYTYTVTFTIDDPAAVGTCATSGGLRNNAALGGSSSGEVTTCSGVPNVTIGKTAGPATPTGTPNQFTIAYTVGVANSGDAAGTYDLADAFAFNGATVNSVSAVAHGGTDPLAATLGTLTAVGGTIVDDETIAAGGAETYTYTVTYTVTNAALAGDCGTPGGGLRNNAALGGSVTGSAATCSGAANVALVKTASAPAPTGTPNQFAITYTVNVANTGTIAGSYDLADALTFNGATINAVSAPAYGSASGDTQTGTLGTFGLPSGGTIVTGEPIAANGAETWTYTVTYTVTDPATAQNCAVPGGGLRNNAEFGGTFNGQSTTCTGAPAVVIGKSADGPTPTGLPNQYAITYLVNVQNNGTLPGTYNIADTFTLPGTTGVTVSAVTHGGSDPLATTLGTLTAAGGTIVTNETIAAGASETYTYTATFTVANPATVGTCAASGGLRNQATLGGSSSGQVSTCSDVPNVVVAKAGGTPVPTGTPNQFTLTYTVTVTNGGAAAGVYDLADAFTFNGATVNGVGAVAHGGTDPLTTTLGTLTAAGGTIVNDEPIAAGGTETYTYTVTYTVTDAATAANCAAPNGGLRNSAALGGSATGSAATCSGAANVGVVKSASAPVPTGTPNQFTLTYTVNVVNSGSVAGSYDLSDALTFNGATVNGVTAPAYSTTTGDTQTGTLGAFGTAGGTIVAGEPITAGGTERWTYTVTYTITDPATAQNCVSPTGGLRNRAAFGGTFTGQGTTCTGAPAVVIGKSALGPTPTGAANQYAITYVVNVQNNGTLPGTYNVADTFTLPGTTGVTASAVTHGGSDPLVTTLGTLTATGGTIVTNETVAAGASETYTYTVTFTVADPATVGTCAASGGLRNNAALGGSSSGQVSTCSDVPNVGVVKALTGEGGTVAGVAEPGEQLTYTITLTNTGGAAATNYGVTDTLDPNVTFVSATNGGTFAAGAVTWTGLTIPAGGTLTLTVVTQVVAPIPAGAGSIGNVAYPTGTTPPNCASTPTPPNCVTIPTQGLVSIAKSVVDGNGNNAADPGETLTYTIVLTNTNGGAVTNYGVTDPLDPNLVFVSASNGGTHAGGIVTWTGLTIPAGGSLTLTLVTTVVDPIPAGVTQIGNVAHATGDPPPNCTIVPPPSNCSSIPTGGTPQLLLTKTANTTTVAPLGTVVYTITVSNVGTAAASGVTISDPIPTGINAYAWTCTSAGGVVCPNASGSGALAESIATFPVGGSVMYTVTATFGANPPANVANTVSVTPSGLAVCAPSGAAPPCVSTVSVIVVRGGPAMPVPSVGARALAMLSLGLVGLAWRVRRQWRDVLR